MRENPDYDPTWKVRHAAAVERFNDAYAAHDQRAMDAALQEQFDAHWAQFPTMAGIRDFLFEHLQRRAESEGAVLVMPVLDDDCTRDEIDAAYAQASRMLDEQHDARFLPPCAQPDGLDAFQGDAHAQRAISRYEYNFG